MLNLSFYDGLDSSRKLDDSNRVKMVCLNEIRLMSCSICGRALENPDDPLSANCGGDCWGCIGEIEAHAGYEPSLAQVRSEFARGLRPGWVEVAENPPKSWKPCA